METLTVVLADEQAVVVWIVAAVVTFSCGVLVTTIAGR